MEVSWDECVIMPTPLFYSGLDGLGNRRGKFGENLGFMFWNMVHDGFGYFSVGSSDRLKRDMCKLQGLNGLIL
jgi:hypothetical protein